MLPPDLLPWHVTVFLMQISGCFPYRMPAQGGPPAFSLPLCLWTVFLKVLIFSLYWDFFQIISNMYVTPQLGIIAFMYCIVISLTIVWLTPFIMAVKSVALGALLDELRVQDVAPPPTHRWYCRPKTLAFLFLFTVLMVVLTYHLTTLSYVRLIEVATIFAGVTAYSVHDLLPKLLCSTVFDLLARRIMAAAELTVAKVSELFAPDGSLKSKNSVEEAMLVLRDLETVIREVEVQRKAATLYFFPVVTLHLLLAVMDTVICPFAILSGKNVGGFTEVMLVLSILFIFNFCHMGQVFIDKIVVAEGLLKDLRIKSRHQPFNIQVSQVMGSLTPMLTFDMRGWYRLDHGSFLTLSNAVLTYLVIIFQYGRTTIDN